jgi:phospholipase/lecithinase/hemolysin
MHQKLWRSGQFLFMEYTLQIIGFLNLMAVTPWIQTKTPPQDLDNINYSLLNPDFFEVYMILFSLPPRLAVFLIGILLTNVSHADYTQVISFGDSLSDTGNLFQTTGSPPPPYFNGRISNGQVWNEVLATNLGLTAPTPSLLGGTNYAWGGAQTNSASIAPSTADQVADFISTSGGSADPGALYTISTGSNDFGGGMTTDAATGVATMVNDLKNAGAQNILVLNLPNLGLVPAAASNPAGATALSSAFNATLSTALVGISGVELVDIFTLSTEIVANPALFGLDNVTDPCITTAFPDCFDHLFWDGAHPTTVGHALIADC